MLGESSKEQVFEALISFAKDRRADFVDFRFTDGVGRWLHKTLSIQQLSPDALHIQVSVFNVTGWFSATIPEVYLYPDIDTMFLDGFEPVPTVAVICDVVEPHGLKPFRRDSRAVARRLTHHMLDILGNHRCYIGVELEYFLFDSVVYGVTSSECFARVQETESRSRSWDTQGTSNSGYRISYPFQHFSLPPFDHTSDLRVSVVNTMLAAGLQPVSFGHESAPNQHEIALGKQGVLRACDQMQIGKYIVQRASTAAGKTATFMPSPLSMTAGSGLHVNLSIQSDGEPFFAVNGEGKLEQTGASFVGGILAHAKALNCLTNSTTNSYTRLRSLYPASQDVGFGIQSRRAAIRVPHSLSSNGARIEIRFPDAACNPYLAFSALLMAGLDGISKNLPLHEGIDAPLSEKFDARRVAPGAFAQSLEEAVCALDVDHEFLLRGGVFTEELIEAHIQEMNRQLAVMRILPHPNEYSLYFGL